MNEKATLPPQEVTCMECRDLLSEYLDRELTEAERASVDHHLRTCTKCANESARLSGLKKFVQHWDGVSGSERFHASVMQKMIHESQMMASKPLVEAADKARAEKAQQVAAEPPGRTPWQVWLIVGALLLAGVAVLAWRVFAP